VAQFKYLQDIIVLGMLVNGERKDTGGRFIKLKEHGELAGKVEVEVNTISLHFPPERIMDAQEYWDKKRKEEK
jgi:hypothetical protein